MKLAIIGSRGLGVKDLTPYLPAGITEIVSGGARGIDSCAREWALAHNIPLKEFLPDYASHGRRAPLLRNHDIVNYADALIAFWDGKSGGTAYTIRIAKERGIPVTVLYPQ